MSIIPLSLELVCLWLTDGIPGSFLSPCASPRHVGEAWVRNACRAEFNSDPSKFQEAWARVGVVVEPGRVLGQTDVCDEGGVGGGWRLIPPGPRPLGSKWLGNRGLPLILP